MTKTPSAFAERVYALTRKVPAGRVTTYKALAEAMGTAAYRAIGQTLRCNPYAPAVPCHRVVSSTGMLNGFNGSRGRKELNRKAKLLRQEGLTIRHGQVENFSSRLFIF